MSTLNATEIKNAFQYADKMLLLVSRTFALNINRLSGNLRKSVLLAYLYLRIADTVEDDGALPKDDKLRLLGLFSAIFAPGAHVDLAVKAFVDALPESYKASKNPNFDLCLHAQTVVPLLWILDKEYVLPVCETVVEMCEGMSSSIEQMSASLEKGWFTLETMSDLSRYCYYVAGIVGKLLTKVFAAKNPAISQEVRYKLETYDVSFGLGLQLANIIKDVREDSERNVCFVPEMICHCHGFESSPAMFAPNADRKARASVMKELVAEAWKHLTDAVEYTTALPRRNPRIRLFCLWPLFMAAKNLSIMGDCTHLFDKDHKVKITRDDVKQIIKSTTLHFYSNTWIKKQFEALRDGA
ncbi:MAG: squalene/phytoene synthase family protein [Fibrobacter sp.]|nr:squalene/phytoene synthase family protein [Fibrobacter sp.]